MFKYFFGLLLFVGTTCKSQDEKPLTGLSGAYLMLSQSLEGNSVDTTFTERKQLKIYTDHYMISGITCSYPLCLILMFTVPENEFVFSIVSEAL